jgi:lysophospholipase L1-like esterase
MPIALSALAPGISGAKGAQLAHRRKLLYTAAILVPTLLLADFALWIFAPVPSPYLVDPASDEVRGKNRFVTYENPRSVTYTDVASAKITPGIDGKIRCSFNAFGFRSPRLKTLEKPAGTVRIFCVGGSTTLCTGLDDSDAWPERLQRELTDAYPNTDFDVVNCGINGESTRGHLNLIAQRVVRFEPDLVVLMLGINDTTYAKFPDYSPIRFDEFSYRTHEFRYLHEKLRWRGLKELACSSQIFRRMVFAKRRASPLAHPDEWDQAGRALGGRRATHARRTIAPLPAELMYPKAEYATNVRSIVGMCRAQGIKVLLVNQPVMWQADMPERLRSLSWMGFRGDVAFDPGDLAKMMGHYNDALADVATDLDLPLTDVAAVVPRDDSAFYDDCHFNVKGSEIVAREIARTITQEGVLEAIVRRSTRMVKADAPATSSD